jgi:TatD DNase family protein
MTTCPLRCLHCRDAFDEIEEALRPFRGQALRGVLHCFTGDEGHAERLVEAGLHVGAGGIATFKPRDDLRRALRRVPDDRLLVETDAPWLAPVPFRGRRNEPAYVRHVADRLAADRDVSPADFARMTTRNADALFRLGLAQRAGGASPRREA